MQLEQFLDGIPWLRLQLIRHFYHDIDANLVHFAVFKANTGHTLRRSGLHLDSALVQDTHPFKQIRPMYPVHAGAGIVGRFQGFRFSWQPLMKLEQILAVDFWHLNSEVVLEVEDGEALSPGLLAGTGESGSCVPLVVDKDVILTDYHLRLVNLRSSSTIGRSRTSRYMRLRNSAASASR